MEKTASGFIKSALRIVLYILLGIIVLSILNVPMTSIVTIIGTMGVTIGLALKDSLSNVSGGFIILLNRPFKVGDYVEAVGITGTVEQIGIFYTTIVTSDNKTAHVPNGSITNSNVLNYSQKELRRLDLEYTISYDSDFEKAKAIINDIVLKNSKVLKDRDIVVRMGRQDASSVVLFVKVWTNHEDYWELNYDLNESIKTQFDRAGIEIPFNQLDIHLKGSEHGEKLIKQGKD
jgi:small conductance mechanosensitive channel